MNLRAAQSRANSERMDESIASNMLLLDPWTCGVIEKSRWMSPERRVGDLHRRRRGGVHLWPLLGRLPRGWHAQIFSMGFFRHA
jgi:hypothetical protein